MYASLRRISDDENSHPGQLTAYNTAYEMVQAALVPGRDPQRAILKALLISTSELRGICAGAKHRMGKSGSNPMRGKHRYIVQHSSKTNFKLHSASMIRDISFQMTA